MDPINRVIWITPVVKAANNNNQYLSFVTQGRAMKNPIVSSSLLFNTFVIRYYTWPDGTTNPGVISGSDNWCFLKQDSSNLPGTSNTYTSTYYAPHALLKVPQENYIN